MAGTYLVKKYPNRKLYDTVTRRYVTLDVVGELVVKGTDVQVIDQASGEDITAATLAQLTGGSGGQRRAASRASSRTRRTSTPRATAASASRLPRTQIAAPIKGKGEQFVGVVRASLAFPSALAQGAVGELAQRASLDSMLNRGRRGGAEGAPADLAELRKRVEMLEIEIERLHGELAELRPVRNGVAHS